VFLLLVYGCFEDWTQTIGCSITSTWDWCLLLFLVVCETVSHWLVLQIQTVKVRQRLLNEGQSVVCVFKEVFFNLELIRKWKQIYMLACPWKQIFNWDALVLCLD